MSKLRFVGLDVHADTIAVAVAETNGEVRSLGVIPNRPESIRKLMGKLGKPAILRVCYEAGPTGYVLYWQLCEMGIACAVVAPNLVPVKPTDRVKTDRRDAEKLARCHRAGDLTAVWVPDAAHEALRDLVRARLAAKRDQLRARNRLSKFLLRHGRVWHDSPWTQKHEQWMLRQHFEEPALGSTFSHYRAMLAARDAELTAIQTELKHWYTNGPFADVVSRLAAYRGIAYVGALTIASEVGDWRRFPTARTFMGFTGLVPSEYSSGASVHRGHITKTGNAHLRTQLVESAWAYQHRPGLGLTLRRRQEGVDPATSARAWTAQQRLCGRFRRLAARKNSRNIVTVAVARELAGFLWAEMTAT